MMNPVKNFSDAGEILHLTHYIPSGCQTQAAPRCCEAALATLVDILFAHRALLSADFKSAGMNFSSEMMKCLHSLGEN